MKNPHRKKKKGLFFLFFGVFLFSLFLFRSPLLRFGLSFVLPSSVSYEILEWQGGKVVAKGVCLKEEGMQLHVDRAELSFRPAFRPLYLEMQLELSHPEILLGSDETPNTDFPLYLFVPTRFAGMKLHVTSGVLNLAASQRFYFTFEPGVTKEEIGKFALSSDPSLFHLPLLQLDLKMEDGNLAAHLKTEEISTPHLFQLAGAFYPPLLKGWKSSQGLVELEAKAQLAPNFSLCAFDAQISGHAFDFYHPELGVEIQGEHMQGKFFLPLLSESREDLWKELAVSFALEDVECFYKLSLEEKVKVLGRTHARLVLEPEKEPTFHVDSILYSGEKKLALQVEGAGKIQPNGSFWTTLDLKLAGGRAPMRAALSLASSQARNYVLQMDVHEMGAELFPLISPWVAFCPKDALIDGKIVAEIKNNHLERLNFQEVKLRDFAFDMPSKEVKAKIDQIEMAGELVSVEEGWGFNQLSIQGSRGKLQFGKRSLKSEGFELNFDQQVITRAAFKGFFEGVAANIEVHRGADPSALIYALVGTATLQETSTIEFGCHLLRSPFSSHGELLALFRPLQGWLRSSALTPNVYLALVKSFDPQMRVDGSINVRAAFDEKKLEFSLQSSELALQHPLFDFHVPQLGGLNSDLKAIFTYEYEKGYFEGFIPIVDGKLREKKSGLEIEKIAGICKVVKDQLSLEGVKAECDKVCFQGNVHLGLSNQNNWDLIIESTSLSAEAADFCKLLQRFSAFPVAALPLTGQITSPAGGLTLYAHMGEQVKDPIAWRFKGEFSHGTIAVSPTLHLKELSCGLEADSHAQSFSFINGHGFLTVADGSSYQVDFPHAVFKRDNGLTGEFGLRLRQGAKEIVWLGGNLFTDEHGDLTLSFDPAHCHFFQTKLHGAQVALTDQGKLLNLDCHLSVPGKELPLQYAFLQKCGLPAFDHSLVSCEGEIDLRVRLSDFLAFEAEGQGVVFRGKPYQRFSIKGEKRGAEWNIKKLAVDGLMLKTSFAFQPKRIVVPTFELSTDYARIQGEGSYDETKQRFTCTVHKYTVDLAKFSANATTTGAVQGRGKLFVDLPSWQMEGEAAVETELLEPYAFNAKSDKNVLFSYSPSSGLDVKKIDLASPGQEVRLSIEKIHLNPELANGSAKSASFFSAKPVLSASTWEMRDLIYAKDNGIWQLGCSTLFQEKPLILLLSMDSTCEKPTCIQLKESPKAEGMKLYGRSSGKKGWQWQGARGKFAGLEVDLASSKTDAQHLTGWVKIDVRELSPYLPKEAKELITQLKLGKGYELTGDFAIPKEGNPSFQGTFNGRNFECMGFVFGAMNAQAEISFERVILEQLSIVDPAGEMQMKQFRLEKRPSTGDWHIEAPLIQVQQLRPSLLRRGKETPREARPLLIKHFSLTDLRGELGMPSSFRAQGHLNFSNSFKKESSLFDVPIQFIKDLGLDLDMLVPVYGEIDLELKGARFYITSLKNAYSEARRAEFYLSEEWPSFVDFKGNVHVDIKMKQNVALKLVEPFTLKVRGTLEKPKFGL